MAEADDALKLKDDLGILKENIVQNSDHVKSQNEFDLVLADTFGHGLEDVKNREFDKAVQNFTFCIKNNYKLVESYAARGIVYKMLDKHDLAISDFSNSLEIDPNNAAIYLSRGMSESKRGELDKAHLDFNKAREINPDLAPEYYEMLERLENIDRELYEIDQRKAELGREIRLDDIRQEQRYKQQLLENQQESLRLQKETLELQKKKDWRDSFDLDRGITTDCSPDGMGGFRCTSN